MLDRRKERYDSNGCYISAEECVCVDDVWDCDVSGFSETESSRVDDGQRYALLTTAFRSSVMPR